MRSSYWMTAFIAAAFAGILAALQPLHAAPLDPTRVTLIDQRGTPFSFARLRGAPVAVTFVATRCTDECPLVNAWFVKLQSRLRAQHLNASLLTITLDPDYDTPRVMAAEGRALGADPRVWRFASGSAVAVKAIMDAFRVHPQRDEHGIPDIHTTFIYILNAQGKVADIELPSANVVDETLASLQERAGARQQSLLNR
jgi:cytochrome oxidase Cu insertion factor (SCO1/SenC/PrrC family)